MAAPPKAPAYCGDVAAFRRTALESADSAELRGAVERWKPPAIVAPKDRAAIEGLARLYIEQCGLTEAIELTTALVAFPTVSSEASAPEHPAFGGLARYLEQWAKKANLGFSVYGAHDAWEITLGQGVPMLGFVMHADVVPVQPARGSTTAPVFSTIDDHPSEWKHPPFRAVVEDGKLFGRGAEDDKGPIASILVVMRALKAMGLETPVQVMAIIGNGEEHDWDGMQRYVAAKRPPLFVVSVDADYPVVIAEAGFVSWSVGMKRAMGDGVASSLGPKIVDAAGGEFLTQVPGEATMRVIPGARQSLEELKLELDRIAAEVVSRRGKPFLATVARAKDGGFTVTARGNAVHSSVADSGGNALWLLSEIAGELRPAPSAVSQVLEIVRTGFVDDHYGVRLGLAYEHPMMGKLLVAPTVLRVKEDSAVLSVNMRRPAGKTKQEFSAALDGALKQLQEKLDARIEESRERYVGDPAIADLEGPLVPTLMDVFQRVTGQPARPISVRGGTYARLFPGAVSFGPNFPGRTYRGHSPDEYIDLDALDLTTRMLLEVTLRVTSPTAGP